MRFRSTALTLLAVGLTSLTLSARAQSGAKVAAPAEARMGTFQLVQTTNKVEVALTSESLAEIERRRQETDEVRWPVSPYAYVRILPRRVINSRGFQPLAPVAPYQYPAAKAAARPAAKPTAPVHRRK